MSILGKIIYFSISSKEQVEKNQQIIRDEEWKWLKKEIPENSKFLDVGCGSGYAMQMADEDLNCECIGIDPDPGAHGVGRYVKSLIKDEIIIKGFAENLPLDNNYFDIVFSSHVLEHVTDEQQSLREMKRVLKDDGILIIGMPTATMALINLFSTVLFTTHIKIYEFFRFFKLKNLLKNFIKIIRIKSHSYPRAQSIYYDVFHYRISNWEKIISKEFEIVKILEPYLHPYPDYPQWFKSKNSKLGASSVFFICRKNQ
ncbi:MAG: class I SAM-dependent methyltransferase [Flavobacteriia bacterium]|nr:class I SAM-dependent methyltransferase [Flavobacteriia bacterium]